MTIPIKKRVAAAVEVAFRTGGDILKRAYFRKIAAYVWDPLNKVNATMIASTEVDYMPLHFASSGFGSIAFGDEKWLVRASELGGIEPLPAPGDWFEKGIERFDVIGAALDPTENLWTFQVRRSLPTIIGTSTTEDWGDLTPTSSDESWGDLGLFDSSEDWNS